MCLICFLLCKEECSSPVSLQLINNVFIGFWDGDYVSQHPYVWYYVVAKEVDCDPHIHPSPKHHGLIGRNIQVPNVLHSTT